MSDKDKCMVHPDRPVAARCMRFNRRYCAECMENENEPVECLSGRTYCEYRPQCMIYEIVKRRRRKQREAESEESASSSPA